MSALNDFLGVDKHGKTYEEFYISEKDKYYQETCKAFESEVKFAYSSCEYAYIASEQFIENCGIAKSVFKRLGLNKIHAYAMTVSKYNFKDFTEEIDLLIYENACNA